MKPGTARFKVESALLEELGERLVSSPEVALIELIKNSYDADATECRVQFSEKEIVVRDDGNGMRLEDFLNLWMVIGTRNKARNSLSQRFSRKVSGSKGIGRFAARFLGSYMTLTTVAQDDTRKRELTAIFDWDSVEEFGDLQQVAVPYSVRDVGHEVPTGTTLKISRLRKIINANAPRAIYTKLLDLVNPIEGFEKPKFSVKGADQNKLKSDPGFTPFVEGTEAQNSSNAAESPAKKILSAYVARARMEISANGIVKVDVTWDKGERSVYQLQSSLTDLYGVQSIGTPALIDIRYFPLRSGVMTSLGVDGKAARSWLTENCGVRVIDNGFRITPYGDADDDWLEQSSDKAKSARSEWRSKPMVRRFSIADKALSPRDNPMLYLPGVNQSFGLVSLATAAPYTSKSLKKSVPDQILTPSMDRQGFVSNTAFRVLRDLARFGIELIAYFDHKQIREEEDREEEEALRAAEDDLKNAVKEIRRSKTIEPEERDRLTSLLRNASVNYAEVDAYRKKTQDSLEIMSLMGVLAGFMTHEFEKTLYRLSEATKTIRRLSKEHSELKKDLDGLEVSRGYLETYLDYSRLFTENLSRSTYSPFPARAQIELVLETLEPIAKKNGIEFDIQASDEIEAPAVPVAAYSGVLLNLVTNAMKSLIARSDGSPRMVRIVVTNTTKKHKLIVADSGIGIPERLRERIWEPLFSTTPRGDNPLGTGMGLGLALVKRVTTNMKGRVELMKSAPAGYSTAFSVELPRSLIDED